MTLETPRLRLRAWEDSDAEPLYLLARDPRVGPIAGWPPHRDLADSRRILHDILQTEESYAIVLKATGAVIGSIGLRRDSDLASGDGERELGYWLGVPYWGRGLIPEAARELLRRAFEALGMRKVWCAYYDGNEKSKRAQEKLGFRYQWTTERVDVPLLGEVRKGHVNCLTKEEWEAQP
jgi:RimJ/RimL family protein N-acetyltransferase